MVMQDLVTLIVTSLPRIIVALLLFLVFWFLANFTDSLIHRVGEKSTLHRRPVFIVLANFAKIGILIIGLITSLGSAGINVSALVASIGLSGLALSIAVKDAVANLLAGIIVLLYQPFQLGDFIQITDAKGDGKTKGEVIKMTLRYTHLREGVQEILVPNSTFIVNNIVITHAE